MILGLDPKFFKPFVDGTIDALRIISKIETTPGKPFLKGTQPQPPFEIAGNIALFSSHFVGNLTVFFQKKIYLFLLKEMLEQEFAAITPDIHDGTLEILDMIFSRAKKTLVADGHTIERATPSVLSGDPLRTASKNIGSILVLPLSCPAGEIHIEISTSLAMKKEG